MSDVWSWFLIALIIINLAGCVGLLWYTSRPRGDGLPTGETTGHVWDGDLTEYNKPLPRWWINLFYLTIVFTLGYVVLYPGFGRVEGTLGWSSQKQHDADKARADTAFAERYARYAAMPVAEIAGSEEALAVGRNLFANHCAQCHGSAARGARGFPNLTDSAWLYGKDEATLLATITHGRTAAMPALGAAIGDDATMTAVATYVQSLSGLPADNALVAVGKAKFNVICAACHGADGKGNPALGAPNLTDADWLYGPDLATIREGIMAGRNGQMPAFGPVLGEARVRLVAAYVHSLSGDAVPPR
jgi:cytochrome c oxidase cbb3-type subunit 3